ncbi:MAG: aldolase/citrate lyase family protein, partial [Flavitalea sp.]
GATKFKPLKGVFLERLLAGEETLNAEMKAYIDRHNAGNLCIANIESVEALNNLEELISVPGLDGVFIGPHDLSVSLMHPEQYDHPVFEEAVKKIIHVCRTRGLSVGIHFSLEPERQIRWVKEGANMIVHSFDIALFTQRLIHDMQVIRNGVGDDMNGMQNGNITI